MNLNIEPAVQAVLCVIACVILRKPKFKLHGGSDRENLALQNLQVQNSCLLVFVNNNNNNSNSNSRLFGISSKHTLPPGGHSLWLCLHR